MDGRGKHCTNDRFSFNRVIFNINIDVDDDHVVVFNIDTHDWVDADAKSDLDARSDANLDNAKSDACANASADTTSSDPKANTKANTSADTSADTKATITSSDPEATNTTADTTSAYTTACSDPEADIAGRRSLWVSNVCGFMCLGRLCNSHTRV